MGDVLTGKVPAIHDGEVQIERPDGSRVIVLVNIAPLTDDRGEVIGAINCFYDITERKKIEEIRHQAEKALRLANEELESVVQKRTASLRRLSIQLMRSQDEERRRIARNLHDSLGQHLASIKMSLDSLSSDASDKDVLPAALKSVEQCISETRTLSSLLHPPLLDEVGFSSAARWYTDEFAKRSGIKLALELPDEGIDRLPELTRIALFRILQESLTNVHRHSASSSVEVRLKVNHQAVLTVRDFGRGMPAELLQGSQTNGQHFGVGLSGIRERVHDLGGTFEIQSSGNGTLIAVSIPLAPQASPL